MGFPVSVICLKLFRAQVLDPQPKPQNVHAKPPLHPACEDAMVKIMQGSCCSWRSRAHAVGVSHLREAWPHWASKGSFLLNSLMNFVPGCRA